jgi:hypothetical protein
MPSAYYVVQDAAASLAAQLANSAQEYQPRPPLITGDICVGCIVWLPPRNDLEEPINCNRNDCCGGEVLHDRGYNHPVVVMSIRQKGHSTVPGDLEFSVACVGTLWHFEVSQLTIIADNYI